jgi:hypothetical protein
MVKGQVPARGPLLGRRKTLRKPHIFVLLGICLALAHGIASAQPWSYDFGTSTGSFSSGSSTTFLPPPPGNGGTARVRIGTAGGSFNLENQAISFGNGVYLRGSAASTTSVNKLSVFDYTPGKAFTLRFRMKLGAADGSASATPGTWYLFVGDSATFSDNSAFTGKHVFAGLQWQFGSAGGIVTQVRSGNGWSTTGLADTPFAQGTTYTVELYGNNSAVTIPYSHGDPRTIGANTLDLWIDGMLAGDDIPKAGLAAEADIDSWMFYGVSSAGNSASIFLDDITYVNAIADSPLPVQLELFLATPGAGGRVTLTWKTMSETNNYGFTVERSTDGRLFETLPNSFVAGHGTTNVPVEYTFTDMDAAPGVWYYRLRQTDLNGAVRWSDVVKVEILTTIAEQMPPVFALSGNFPNPFNPSTCIRVSLGAESIVRLRVYDVAGREVRTLVEDECRSGVFDVGWDGTDRRGAKVAGGVYFCHCQATPVSGGTVFTAVKGMLLLE